MPGAAGPSEVSVQGPDGDALNGRARGDLQSLDHRNCNVGGVHHSCNLVLLHLAPHWRVGRARLDLEDSDPVLAAIQLQHIEKSALGVLAHAVARALQEGLLGCD